MILDDTQRQALIEQLQAGEVTVTFTKVSGEQRVMTCTLSESVLPAATTESKKKPNPDVLCVWDTSANGWRSFRWDSIIAVSEDDHMAGIN